MVRTKTPAQRRRSSSTGSTSIGHGHCSRCSFREQGRSSSNSDQPVNNTWAMSRCSIASRPKAGHLPAYAVALVRPDRWGGDQAAVGPELPKSLEKMLPGSIRSARRRQSGSYNNFAYGMAGLLIEKISGQEYEKYMGRARCSPRSAVTTAAPSGLVRRRRWWKSWRCRTNPEVAEREATPVEQVHSTCTAAGGTSTSPRGHDAIPWRCT